MRKTFFFLLLLLLSRAVFAQPLVGTWVSNQLILATVRFSLTFRSDMTYQIDTILGRTIGTYTFTEDRITFTPTKVGINGGMVGDNDVYSYAFQGEDTLSLKSKGSEVELTRAKSL